MLGEFEYLILSAATRLREGAYGAARLLTDAGAAQLAPFFHRGSAAQCELGQRRDTPRLEREP
jgi:hypothetical protein